MHIAKSKLKLDKFALKFTSINAETIEMLCEYFVGYLTNHVQVHVLCE